MNCALHQAVTLQAAQRLREHFLRNAADLALQRGVAHRSARQDLNYERRPFISDPVEHKPRRALRFENRRRRGHFSYALYLIQAPAERNIPNSLYRLDRPVVDEWIGQLEIYSV
jgi:hypothetical protein